MVEAVIRKLRQLTQDPVLRQWLIGRLFGRYPPPPAFQSHKPPYLDLSARPDLPTLAPAPSIFAHRDRDKPVSALEVRLPGTTVMLDPGDPADLFHRSWADTEILLAAHRFSWLPACLGTIEAGWVDELWKAWRRSFMTERSGWPWHPYTAGERALNLLAFGQRFGLPGEPAETTADLESHLIHVAQNLEYFGDHHTSNHLSNNGRSLFVGGLLLDRPWAVDMGVRILLEEANRILLPSGILREGSSHYHLLVARNYLEAWLSAKRFAHPDAGRLEEICEKLLGAAEIFALPGGLPLIGDISPDYPPEDLTCLIDGDVSTGWASRLDERDRAVFQALYAAKPIHGGTSLEADGWVTIHAEPWSSIWHVSPEGWSHMPGHGHQDCGSFELHFGKVPIIVDPGRGAYGDTGEADLYRSAVMHNGIMIDGKQPYPPNRPYYDPGFRDLIAEIRPRIERGPDFMRLVYKSSGCTITRLWRFDGRVVHIEDEVTGSGTRSIIRNFHTPLEVDENGGQLRLSNGSDSFRLSASDSPRFGISPSKYWSAYGRSIAANSVSLSSKAPLPWRSTVTLEVE